MNDKDINQRIKEQSELLEIPDALKPEQIKNKLDEQQKNEMPNKKIKYYKCGFLAAAVLLLLIILPMPKFSGDIETSDTIPTASSYKSIYKMLSSYQKSLMNDYLDGGALPEGAVAETMQASLADTESAAAVSSGSGDFSQTNIQVEGVDEGDIIKTDGNYIYILDLEKQLLQIVKAEGETITPVSKIELTEQKDEDSNNQDSQFYNYQYYSEFYLEQDRLLLISTASNPIYDTEASASGSNLIAPYWSYESNSTIISIYDISDRTQPRIIKTLEQDGYYTSSRKADGILYLFSYYNAYLEAGSEKPELYIPYTDGSAIEENCIYIPEYVNSTGYLVITSVDIHTPDRFQSELAVIANPYDYYVSSENIYIANGINSENSEIMKFSYKDGSITPIATNEVPGITNNSFSFDEYNGYLRVVTTVYGSTQSNNLYVLDNELNIVGRIEDLAEGEQIYSARFFGDTGYFVTFKRVDPLFSVDLSEPEKPRVLGELKISGFSSYLHFYSENLLLGIGYEADPQTGRTTDIKLSMFDISDPSNVKELDKQIIPNAYYSPAVDNHKSVLINPQKNILGLMFYMQKQTNTVYTDYRTYQTFSYNEESGFTQEISHTMAPSIYMESRGLYIGNYLYIAEGSSRISIYSLTDHTLLSEWTD